MNKIFAILIIAIFLASCGKEGNLEPIIENADYTCPTCTVLPEAKPKHDIMSSGIYKGVLVGSSGTVYISLHNSGTEKEAVLTLDGKSTTLTTSSLDSWAPGDTIDKAMFTGTLGGKDVQLIFSVLGNGLGAIAEVTVPDHNLTTFIFKETSTVAIKSFEGDYSGDEGKGVFNLVVNGNDVAIILSGKGAPVQTRVESRLIEFVAENGLLITGKFYNDAVGGSWKNVASGAEGGWKALRTL